MGNKEIYPTPVERFTPIEGQSSSVLKARIPELFQPWNRKDLARRVIASLPITLRRASDDA